VPSNQDLNSKFQSEYQKLNPEQQLAVDTIDGPVMVIAGAGTGKTQTIALRIANILDKTQTPPSSILCLTFTDNAAINMRQRLLSVIGSTAYSLKIQTFHAFCNSIISQYPEYFLTSTRDAQAVSDINQIQIIRQLIDQLPSDSPLKNIASPYFYQNEIIKNISTLKREAISPQDFSLLIDKANTFSQISTPISAQLAELRASQKTQNQIVSLVESLATQNQIDIVYRTRLQLFLNYFQQSEFTLSQLKSQVRSFIDKTTQNLQKQSHLQQIYQQYQQELSAQSLVDYDDMILKVISVLQNTPTLLSEIQEKYQYILVDEFQDTNNSQYQIINLISSSQSNPNLFVVGDDDQSIYRFQGASVENIFSFYQQFQKHIKVIVLKNNYRSHRLILETSQNVIGKNINRITNYIPDLDKSLSSVSHFDPDPINLFAANTPLEENEFIADKISKLINSGTSPDQIAVLYRNNKDIQELLPHLAQKNINYLVSDTRNILGTPEIIQLITLFKLIIDPTDELALSQVLSSSYLKIPSLALYRLFLYSRRQHLPLSQIISSTKRLKKVPISRQSKQKISQFVANLAMSSQQMAIDTPDTLFNDIIRRFSYLDWLLSLSNIDLLKQLNGLYSHLKHSLSNQKITFNQWVDGLNLLIDNNLSINSLPPLITAKNSIRAMTVHKSKGLEFEHVFLYKVQSGKWDSAPSRNLLQLPLGVLKTDISQILVDADTEEDRRLFYVALTRAKQQIYISYSKRNQNDKEQLVSLFVNDIDPRLVEQIESSPNSESDSLLQFFSPQISSLKSPPLANYLQDYLSNKYRFNITHLNSYHRCPLCFFFKTILRLPYPKTSSLSFGTAIHGALAYLFATLHSTNQLISLDKLTQIFIQNLKHENLNQTDFKLLSDRGQKLLSDYYSHYQDQFSPNCLVEHDFKSYNIRLNDIPITGKIDKIEINSDKTATVIDYKTGKPDSKYQQLSPDGDYFKQLVFYKLLCDHTPNFPYQINSGAIDFVQPNSKQQFVKKQFNLTPQHVEILSQDISQVWQQIQQLNFPPSDDCPDENHLHHLCHKYFK